MSSARRWGYRFACFILLVCVATAAGAAPKRYNGTGREVMLQGFHWTSYKPELNGDKHWYVILQENASTIRDAGFDCVWFPPPSASAASDNAYLPTEWYKLDNGYGNEAELRQAIQALGPAKAICDIVVNHRCGSHTDGPDYENPAFDDNAAATVRGDDNREHGHGMPEERHRDGSDCEGNGYARDLDHTNYSVQDRVMEFQEKLKEVGFAGWRYDQVKGFGGEHVGLYNVASNPFLSVGEYWVEDTGRVLAWIDETGRKSMAFDFPTRAALVDATLNRNYWRLKTIGGKAPGVIGVRPEMAVTFIENHDTEPVRDNGAKRFPADRIMQGYAYVLTHPGVPCVFWRHFFDSGADQKAEILKLIKIRRDAGITASSVLWIEPDTNGKYAAIIGDKVAMKIGPAPWNPAGNEWQLATSGSDYAVWTKQQP